jgi:tRNA modification GTPase
VLVRSKADCVGGVAGEVPAWAGRQVVTSAVSGAGLGELRRAVLAAAGVAEPGGDGGEAVVVARERQRDALVEAAGAAAQAAVELGAQPAEVAAVGLRQCARALGRITGEEVTPDVLEAVFSRFCVGK